MAMTQEDEPDGAGPDRGQESGPPSLRRSSGAASGAGGETEEIILPESEPLPAEGWVVPPRGWTNFMREIGAGPDHLPAAALLDGALWQELWDDLSRACRTPYHADIGGDLWRPDWEGDCEDKCLAMRADLAEKGWPSGALRLTLCKTELGEDHCVLSVETDRGVFVLDERARSVVSWRGLPYVCVAREVPGRLSLWEKIAAGAPGI